MKTPVVDYIFSANNHLAIHWSKEEEQVLTSSLSDWILSMCVCGVPPGGVTVLLQAVLLLQAVVLIIT